MCSLLSMSRSQFYWHVRKGTFHAPLKLSNGRYTKEDRYGITLTSLCGKTMLDCRCEIVERYWTGSLALMFRLPRGRFIIGYALGDGMLFRGELIDECTDDDARRQAAYLAQFFGDLDAEDEEAFRAELAEA